MLPFCRNSRRPTNIRPKKQHKSQNEKRLHSFRRQFIKRFRPDRCGTAIGSHIPLRCPATEGLDGYARLPAYRSQAGTFLSGFFDQLDSFSAIRIADHSPSWSAQIACNFFRSISNAAASARAFSFRFRSRSRSRLRFRSPFSSALSRRLWFRS